MLYFNAQSIFANINQLKTNITNQQPPIILLSETRLTGDISDAELSINNYKIYRTDSISRHTGGVAAYVRNDITVKNVERFVFEMNWWLLSLTVKINEWTGIIACSYHSPSSNDNDFVTEFLNWCGGKIDNTPNCCAIGDFNIDWLNDSTAKRRLAEGTNDIGLTQIINQPTRITNNSATLIDLCFSSDKHLRHKKS